MSGSPLGRNAGPITVVAALFFVLTQLAFLLTVDRAHLVDTLADPVYRVNGVLYFFAFCGLLIAVVALHERQARSAGALGVCAGLVGTMLMAGDYWFEAFAMPWVADREPSIVGVEASGLLSVGGYLTHLGFAICWVLFGIALLRAGVVSKPASWAVIAGGVVAVLIGIPPLGVPLGLALAWVGVELSRQRVPAIATA